ncbi:hypothetical protein RFI_36316 [Reticulomyxa filosa]|uniref:Uncharacterized protein n=1 Tax=Reticulomyxa filosa TaxID=46433 RepID=X6LHN3_RETFI|nr:hypothetical protein RFI_36316 [Reticulomyxa filosa]|eukprot:ETO01124.1 hypothetical protein RFI_36316 [Reticulomyxa filosa]
MWVNVFLISFYPMDYILHILWIKQSDLGANVLLKLEKRQLVLVKEFKIKNKFRKQRIPRNLMTYKSFKQLRRKLQLEKHQHMVNSINSLHEGNTRNLFKQFKALNTNKIFIIPALVNNETSPDIDRAYLLAKTFAEYPQPPKDVDEKHYEMVEDNIRFKLAISIQWMHQ